jgi:excisionase family DNA binding protein
MAVLSTAQRTKKLITETEAASLLGISRRTLQKWRLTGGGPEYLKVGKCVRYAEDCIQGWLERCRRRSTSEMVV